MKMSSVDVSDTLEWYRNRYRTFESKKDVSSGTIEQRISELDRFSDWMGVPLAEAAGEDIQSTFLEKVGDGYQPTTLSCYRTALSKFYRHMEQDGRIEKDPMEDVNFKDMSATSSSTTAKEIESDRGERIHPLKPEEVEQLIENVPSPKIRNELLIRLMVQTGMRAGEVEYIKLDNIDFDDRLIEIIETKSQPRTVSYAPNLSSLMDLWVNGGNRDVFDATGGSPYLFLSRKKERLRADMINKIVVRAAHNAEEGIQKKLYEDAQGGRRWRVTSHALRHTFAVLSLSPDVGEGSVNLAYLRDQMGHTDISVTQQYLRYIEDDALKEMKRCQPRL